MKLRVAVPPSLTCLFDEKKRGWEPQLYTTRNGGPTPGVVVTDYCTTGYDVHQGEN